MFTVREEGWGLCQHRVYKWETWVPWQSVTLLPFNRQIVRLQLYRQESSAWLSWLYVASALYRYSTCVHVCVTCIIHTHTHSGVGPFLNSEKWNKMSDAQNSDISQFCGVLSNCFQDHHNIWLCQNVYCGACSRTCKREFPFAGVAENRETLHCLGILLYV